MTDHPDPPAGIRWGPFTTRIPFVHTRIGWPEFWQGFLVAAATGLALVPILTGSFGLTFNEAVAFIMIQTVLIASAPIVFGEPYAPGWITPVLPLVLVVIGGTEYDTPADRLHFMTAAALDLAAILFVLGATGLGRRLIDWLPTALKAGIILGAAVAALKRVFLDSADRYLWAHPVSTTVASAVCLLLLFSEPVRRLQSRHPWLGFIAGLGLLPGFLAAAAVGPLFGEISYAIEWGILVPPVADVYHKVSPFAIGWPSADTFLDALPLALMAYVVLYGDLITGTAVLKDAAKNRPDEPVAVDFTRSHLSLGIRNAVSALFAPFFSAQGALWAGVHVVIARSWGDGRGKVRDLFSKIVSYYSFGIPAIYLLLPLMTFLKPLAGVALAMTLILTGVACAFVAMALPRTPAERGVAVLMACALAFLDKPWVGMAVGLAATAILAVLKNSHR